MSVCTYVYDLRAGICRAQRVFGSPGTSVLDIGPTKPRSSARQLAFLTAEPSSLKLRSCFSMGAQLRRERDKETASTELLALGDFSPVQTC